MSRIGNAIITISKEVTLSQEGDTIVVKGAKGSIVVPVPKQLSVVVTGENVKVERKHNDKTSRALHGYMRAVLSNAVVGVTKGWTKTLEMAGVGYRAAMSGSNLTLSVGFSHQVTVTPPTGITFTVADGKIQVSGTDRQAVGQAAAKIREVRKPEPYKGKGIKYEGEYIRRKAGKAKAAGAAAK
jgi:large subunit ribosomal protein L6